MKTAELVLELIMSLPAKDQEMIHNSLMGSKEKKSPEEDFGDDPMVDELDSLYKKAWL